MTIPALRLLEPVLEPLAARLRPGRLVELSGTSAGGGGLARTSTAVAILRRVQRDGETAAWIQPTGGALFPPDLHDAGIDLDALVVVHIGSGATGLCKAAELLIRSGAFGLLVVDLIETPLSAPAATAWLGRMLGLARQHESHVVLLTDKPTHADSIGTLVGLRIESHRHRDPPTSSSNGQFLVEHHVIKNKSGAPFDVARDRHRGPDGLLP